MLSGEQVYRERQHLTGMKPPLNPRALKANEVLMRKRSLGDLTRHITASVWKKGMVLLK